MFSNPACRCGRGEAVRFGSRLTIQPKEWEILKAKNVHTAGSFRYIPRRADCPQKRSGKSSSMSLKASGKQGAGRTSARRHHQAQRLAGIHEAYLQVHFRLTVRLFTGREGGWRSMSF
jgi:hypothetical protein